MQISTKTGCLKSRFFSVPFLNGYLSSKIQSGIQVPFMIGEELYRAVMKMHKADLVKKCNFSIRPSYPHLELPSEGHCLPR